MEKKYYNKNNINLFIIVFGLITFTTKWCYSYFYFNEEIEARIIFESVSDGYYNLAVLKSLVNFDLSNSFSPLIDNLGSISIPLGAYILHFIFYSIIGTYSFVILEIFFIIFFIIIFYKISRLFNLNRIQSLTVAILLFNTSNIIQILNLTNIQYFTVIFTEFYSLRLVRPLVSTLFFYLFIYLILKSEKKNFFTIKNSIVFGITSSLLFSSYFHAFFLQQIILIFYLFYRYKLKVIKILKINIKYILFYILTFLIVSLPFLMNTFFTDADFLQRGGVVEFDLKKKLILLEHIFFKLFKIQFLFILFSSIFLLLFFNKKNNLINFKKINLLFIIFYTSIITPFLFILVSPKFLSHFTHFTNLVLITAFILFFYIFILSINFLIKKKISINLINNFSFLLILILVIGNIYIYNNNYKLKNLNNERFTQRNEFNSIINIIRKKNILESKKVSLLTFDTKFLVWATIVDVEYLTIVNGVLASRTNDMMENDLINTFKYLKLSKNDFKEFIKNKKVSSWRYKNDMVRDSFWMRYQANSMITLDETKNFDPKILEFISKSSPLLSQQLIMPNHEIKRFLSKYKNPNNSFFYPPKIIIINKKDLILKKSYVDKDIFCKAFEGKIYDLYYSFELNNDCVE